ncbi:alpha/beta-hydrolase [Marasmius fiardii PR-910]|nr:alpha/beta-hydrolase [Marasmius fiardii PR-910]
MPDESNWPTIFDPTTCTRKGLCPVTTIREQVENPLQSHSLYYEVHGSGPEKIVLIMGLNSSSFAWFSQVEYFSKLPGYTVLAFDNRGVGNSGTPKGPYTTSGMAEDAICLLDFIGWTEKQLATRIPERIASLTLAVTTRGGRPWSNLPPWKGVSSLTKITFTKEVEVKIPFILEMLYPISWLDEVAEDDPERRTNRELQATHLRKRIALTRLQTMVGAFSQMSAGLTHYVSDDRLRKISASIPKVLILTGDVDNLVDPRNSIYLKSQMPEAEFVQWETTGHGIHYQRHKWFNETVERVSKEGRAKVDAGFE